MLFVSRSADKNIKIWKSNSDSAKIYNLVIENVETEKIYGLTVDQKMKLQAIARNLNEIFSSRKYAQVPSDNEILRRQIRSQITEIFSFHTWLGPIIACCQSSRKKLKIFSNPITKAACISVETRTDLIEEHWKIVAATSCTAIVTFLFFQNFKNSYWKIRISLIPNLKFKY